jgi:hypothetical protein
MGQIVRLSFGEKAHKNISETFHDEKTNLQKVQVTVEHMLMVLLMHSSKDKISYFSIQLSLM